MAEAATTIAASAAGRTAPFRVSPAGITVMGPSPAVRLTQPAREHLEDALRDLGFFREDLGEVVSGDLQQRELGQGRDARGTGLGIEDGHLAEHLALAKLGEDM